MASKKSIQRSVSKSKVGGKRPEALLDESLVAAAPAQSIKTSRAALKKPLAEEQQQAEVLASAEASDAAVVDLSDVVPLVADVALAPVPAATSLESLLVQVATGDTKGGNDSGISPWWLVAGGAGVAALVASGGSSSSSPDPVAPPPPAPPAPQGFVVDGFVKNVVVFRDTDGDGMWKDVNGDGIWQAGDEFITVTNENGSFDNLAGTGGFVAASLRMLMSTNGLEGDERTTVQFNTGSRLIGSNGEQITGEAIDLDTNQPFTGFFVADDVKLAGPAGSSVYITGVSTLVAVLLAAEENPTTADLLEAAQKVAVLLNVPFDGTFDAADAIALFTGEQNTQLSSVLASVAASARAADIGLSELEAVFGFLSQMRDAANNGGIADEDGFRPVDLTSANDVNVLFFDALIDVVSPAAAQALAETLAASAVGPAGAAQQAVFAIAPFDGDSVFNTLDTDTTYGHVSVLAAGASSDVSLFTSTDVSVDVSVDVPVGVTVQVADGSNLRVEAAGFSADASLFLGNVSGLVGNITSQASGSQSSVEMDVRVGDVSGDITVSATGESAFNNSSIVVSGDLVGDIVAAASNTEADLVLSVVANNVSGDVEVNASAERVYASVDIDIIGNVDGDVTVEASGLDAFASVDMRVGGDVNGDIKVTSSSEDALASLDLTVDGTVNGNVAVGAGGVDSTASLDLHVSGDLTGNVTLDAKGEDAYAFASIDVVGNVSGDVTVKATGVDAFASLSMEVDGNVVGNVTVEATAESADASIDLEVYGDLTGDLTVEASGVDSSASMELFVSGDLKGNIILDASGEDSLVFSSVDVNGSVSGDVTVKASAKDAFASLSMDVDGQLDGNLVVEADGENAYASLDLYVSGDLSGSISVTAKGGSADTVESAPVEVVNQLPTLITIDLSPVTDICVDIGADAYAYVYVDGALSGNIDVAAEGVSAEASLDLYVGGSADGNVSIEASGQASSASVEIEVDGAFNGDVTVEASGAKSQAYLSLDVSGDVGGNLSVEASGQDALVSAEVSVGGSFSGDVTVTASGSDTLASLDMDVQGDLNGNLTVEASGEDSTASLDIRVNGALSGDVTVEASASGAMASLDLYVSGDLNGNIVVKANDGSADVSTDLVDRAEAEVEIDVGGSLVGNIEVLAQGVSADVSLDLNVNGSADGNVTIEASGEASSASVEIEIDGSLTGDVTVKASGAQSYAFASLDVDSGDLMGNLTVEASGDSSDAILSVDLNGLLSGDIVVEASGKNADASLDLYVNGDMNGNITIEASGESAEATSYANIYGSSSKEVVGGPIAVITAESGEVVPVVADSGDVVVLSGDVSITASGKNSFASIDLYVDGGVDGNLTVEASGVGSLASVEIDIDGGLTGTLTVEASGESTDAMASVDVNGLLSGDVTVEASGADAFASLELEVDGLDGNLTVEASGADAFASIDLDVYGDMNGNLTVEASAVSAEAQAYVRIDGPLSGDVTVTASQADAFASLDLSVSGDLNGNLTVEASGDAAFASIDLEVSGDLNGGITIDALTGGKAQASVDVSGDIEGDLVVHASGEGAVADLSLSFSGNLGGELDVKAEDGGKVYLHDGEGSVVLNEAISGDFSVQVSGDGTEAHLALVFGSGDTGMITVSADDGASVANLSLDMNGQVQGAVTVLAQGDASQALLNLDVDGELVEREGIREGSTVVVLEGGTIEGNVTAQASGAASLAQADVATDGDIEGSVTVVADGGATGEVNQVPLERQVQNGPMGFVNINDVDIDSLPASVFQRAEELNTSNGVMGSDDNPGFARASISLDVQDDVFGEVRVGALGDRASAQLVGDVGGDLKAGLIVDGFGDRSAAYVSLDVDGDIDVVSNTNTAVFAFADGEDSTVAVSLDVGDDITGNVEVGVDGEGALAVAVIDVSGDIEGSIEISVTADHAAAYVSLEVGGQIMGSIDLYVSGEQSQAGAYVSFTDETQTLNRSVDLTVEDVTSSARFAIEQATQNGQVFLNGQGRFEVGMVGGSVLDSININRNEGIAGIVDVVVSEGGANESNDFVTVVNGFNTQNDIIRALTQGNSTNVGLVINTSNEVDLADLINVAELSFSGDIEFAGTGANFYVAYEHFDDSNPGDGGNTYVAYDSDGDQKVDGILNLGSNNGGGYLINGLTEANFLSQQNIDIVGQSSVSEGEFGLVDVGGQTQGDAIFESAANLGRVSVSNRELPMSGVNQIRNQVSFDVELQDGGRIGDVSVLAVDHVERTGSESVSLSIDGSTSNSIGSAMRQSNVNVLAQGDADASLELNHVGGSIASLTVGATAANPGITRTGGTASVQLVSAGYSGESFGLGFNGGLILGDVHVGALTGVAGGEFTLTAEDSALQLMGDITVQAGGVDTTADVNLSSAYTLNLGGQQVQGQVGDVLVQAQDGGTATLTLGLYGTLGNIGNSTIDSLTVSAGTAPPSSEDIPVQALLAADDAAAHAEALVVTDSVGSATVEAFDNATAHLNLSVGGSSLVGLLGPIHGGTSVTADVLVTGGADVNGVDDQAKVELQFSQGSPVWEKGIVALGWLPQPETELSLSVLVSDLDRGIDMVDGKYQMTMVDLELAGSGDLSLGFIGSETTLTTSESGDTYLSIDDFLMEADEALDGELQMFTGQIGDDWYVALDEDGVGVSALVTISSLQVWTPNTWEICQ